MDDYSYSYRAAATTLWGEAGAAVHDAYAHWRTELFPELPEQMPIVIGITAYGACVGLTRYRAPSRLPIVIGITAGVDGAEPTVFRRDSIPARISVASNVFAHGRQEVEDVMVHEMLHVHLEQRGEDPGHDGEPWYAAVRRLSPVVLGRELDVRRGAARRSVRVPNPRAGEPGQPATLVRKVSVVEAVPHAQVARWPTPFRVRSRGGKPVVPIPCPSC